MAKVRGLYQRPDSEVWWITYTTADGRRVRESAKTTDRDAAQRILDDKRGRIARGEVFVPRLDKITYDEAKADLRVYYETHRTRDVAEADARLKHLDAFFSGRRLSTIGQDTVTEYAAQRLAPKKAEDGTEIPGAANGTINRELATLSKLLRLAYEHGKLQRLPVVKKLREADPRAGFVTREQFMTIRQHLPEELQAAMTVAYTFGWRKREVLDLKKGQYNAKEGTLRLDPGTTKNREGRVVRVTSELRAMLDAQIERVRELERKAERVIPWLFPHLDGAHAGERIADPRKAWEAACRASGLPGLLIHDLRRSAVRNMEQAGVPRSVAMKLTGHKTENVYRRYAIVSDADLEEAARRIAGRAGSVTFPSRSAASAGNTVS
jgi:integrase